ncbi:NirA family protein [Pelagicoccus sp. SDUM812003]|uniref:NirA family protein n=1 Tax=Pelagicoccus sp. SDUM812003 TaxID=3041267 RepID=UPI00280FD109|nr:NirA family protein [Pelagicoccus sp. SDUM812003]MDQ8203786.1 NirA family protein [Pelagicoccus sp. SDUM812003]
MNSNLPFTPEQKEYLSGFFAGASQRGFSPFLGKLPDGSYTGESASAEAETVYGTPLDELSKEERIKHEKDGLDCYEDIAACAAKDELPQGADVFRFKYYGLFNVSPAQESLMLRCRIAGGLMQAHQLEGMAEMAEDWAGGYAHITTRANFQLREIQPRNAIKVLEKLVDLGLTSRGAGADNLRNITGSPTAGFDPDELFDVRPLAKAMHHLILNTREFYGLPRKFNISFDGGGAISVCADTNDIAFYAVRVGEGQAVEPGVYFRVQLAGITGHKQFAKDCGILIAPEQCLAVAAAMIRVFIENGDRTNRKKARLKYLIDSWGDQKFVQETEKKLDFELVKMPLENCQQRVPIRRHGHLGVHAQSQEGLSYVGARIPVGRMLPDQMKAIAALARRFGNGEIRLTVWQNLLIPNVRNENVDTLVSEIERVGFSCQPDMIRGGLVACTGSFGCKYASADTKSNAVELGEYLSERFQLDAPINIHLTGCPHSCAQHYVGDIGLQAVRVKVNDESVDGYNIVFGGGVDDEQAIAKEVFKSVPFFDVKPLLANALERFLELREGDESFIAFNRRHSAEELKEIYAVSELMAS